MIKDTITNFDRMKVLVAGDYYPNERATARIERNDTAFVDSSIRDLIKSSDFSIVNFECPIVEGNDSLPILKSGPNLKTGRYAATFLKQLGFSMSTLANNHTLDYGGEALLYTKKCLESEGILTVGVGNSLNDAEKTAFVNVDGKKLAIINCCEHEYSIASDRSPGANPLNPIKQFYRIKEAKEQADYVLMIIHGGNEHFQLPSPRMQEVYRFFIEQGADAVVNHHQHCPCGYEVWNGKPIFYGIGNFCFDNLNGDNNKMWNYGYLVVLDFSDVAQFSIHPYCQFGDKPTIEALKDKDKEQFIQRIESLNIVVASPDDVKVHYDDAMKKMAQGLKFLFTPWQGRLSIKLYERGLLPSLMNKKKTIYYHNCLQCESQKDKIQVLLDSIYESLS